MLTWAVQLKPIGTPSRYPKRMIQIKAAKIWTTSRRPLQLPSPPPPSTQVTRVLYSPRYMSPCMHIYADICPSSGLFGRRVICEYQMLAFQFIHVAAFHLSSFLPIPPPAPPSYSLLECRRRGATGRSRRRVGRGGWGAGSPGPRWGYMRVLSAGKF